MLDVGCAVSSHEEFCYLQLIQLLTHCVDLSGE